MLWEHTIKFFISIIATLTWTRQHNVVSFIVVKDFVKKIVWIKILCFVFYLDSWISEYVLRCKTRGITFTARVWAVNLRPCFLKKHSPNRSVFRATESWLVVLYWEPVINNYWSLNSIDEKRDKIYTSLVDLLHFYSLLNSFWNFSCCRQHTEKVAVSKIPL